MHRLLQAAIEQDTGQTGGAALAEVLQLDANKQNATCKNCNQKKMNSKNAQVNPCKHPTSSRKAVRLVLCRRVSVKPIVVAGAKR